jgi:hypothetical protein
MCAGWEGPGVWGLGYCICRCLVTSYGVPEEDLANPDAASWHWPAGLSMTRIFVSTAYGSPHKYRTEEKQRATAILRTHFTTTSAEAREFGTYSLHICATKAYCLS